MRDLTGDFVLKIDCMQIQNSSRKILDEVIYFGPPEDLKPKGLAEHVTELSIMDRYNFDE